MAATPTSELSDGPVLSLLNKRLRALRKKHNRILQMEEAISQGKPINKEQEDVLRSKPSVLAAIDELEKLRQPLASALAEELSLAAAKDSEPNGERVGDSDGQKDESSLGVVEDLLNLLYFGSLFDVRSQSDFTSTMLTRTHERGCCLTYDYVTDEATDLLGERDLDLISMLGGLLISRPVDSSLSHKNALQRCIEHAKLWLTKSEEAIEPNAAVTYAGLRERLYKIMGSDYFTTTPEMKAPVEVVAAAATGNYATFQVPGTVIPVMAPAQVEDSAVLYEQKDEDASNLQGHETGDSQSSPVEELQKDQLETENPAEVVSLEQENVNPQAGVEHNHPKDTEAKEEQQYLPRRNYQNQRGGRGSSGGGRRGYSNGRGGRGSSWSGGVYQNGRNQYYDQTGNYYQRTYYYNNRGRGGRSGGQSYNGHGLEVQEGHAPAD